MGRMEEIREHIKTKEVNHETAENAATRVLDWARSKPSREITKDGVIGVLLAAGVMEGPAGLAVAGILTIVLLAIEDA
jgi:hypothetical protein